MTRTGFCTQNREIIVCHFLRETKKRYYDNLNESCVTNNNFFWKTVKPFLSDKVMTRDKIYLTKNDKIIKLIKKQPTI